MTSPTSLIAGNTLAIDTSGSRGSIALGTHQVTWDKKAVHSELATVKLEELLVEAHLNFKDVQRIMVNVGPGSFTGIRVGVNLARTLAYSLNVPICGRSSLELLAANASDSGTVFVAVKAIQSFFYVAGYEVTALGLVQRLAPKSAEEADLVTLARNYQEVLIDGSTQGFRADLEARNQLDLLARWPDSTNFSTWKEIHPIYIRASEAEEKLLKGLLKA